jgi:hypothetical protein
MRRSFLISTEVAGPARDLISDLYSPDEVRIVELEPDDLINSFPKELQKYLVFEIETGDLIKLDVASVVDLLDYLVDRPRLVCKTIIKLHMAVSNLFHLVYDDYNEAKEKLEEHVAERTAFFSNTENDLPFKRTKDNVEKMVKSEETWKKLNRSVVKLESTKSRLYTTKGMLDRFHKMCDDFVKNSVNIVYDGSPQDRSFNEVVAGTIEATAQVKARMSE